MALASWNVLAVGKFRTGAEEERRRTLYDADSRSLFGGWGCTDKEKRVSAVLEKVAGEIGANIITAGLFSSSFH